MEQIVFNMNEYVKVKLKIKGWETLSRWHNRFATTTEERLKRIYEVDEDGYTEFQLWNLVQIFGDQFYMGNDNYPFDLSIVIMKDSR